MMNVNDGLIKTRTKEVYIFLWTTTDRNEI